MDGLSTGWIPGIRGRHLPIPIVPRWHAKNPPCSRRSTGGALQLLPLSASASIGTTSPGFSKKISIFRVGEAPFCQFLPYMQSRLCNMGTSSQANVQRLSRTSTGPSLPQVPPLALSEGSQEYPPALQPGNLADCEVGSSLSSEIVPCYTQPNASELNERPSMTLTLGPSCFDRCYGREICHKDMLSRLESAEEAAAPQQKNPECVRALMSASDQDEPLRSASSDSNVLGHALAMEDENWLQKGGPLLRETGKLLQLKHPTYQRLKETRSPSMLKHHQVPLILGRFGFQFPHMAFFQRQSHQRAAKPAVIARAMDSRISSRESSTGAKIGILTRERVGRSASYSNGSFRHGRVRDRASKLFSQGSGGSFGSSLSARAPTQNRGAGRRSWARAHSGVESAGNLLKDILTIIGLVAFVVYGTYAFAVSQKYLKSGLGPLKKIRTRSVVVARPAQEEPRNSPQETEAETVPTPANVAKAKVVEITDENFVDTIQRRPTFVLFYATWCPFCQRLDPTWKELGNILSSKGYNIQLGRINAEIHQSIAANFKVVKYPSLIFFRGGVAVENYLGPRTVNSLVEFVEETLNKPS